MLVVVYACPVAAGVGRAINSCHALDSAYKIERRIGRVWGGFPKSECVDRFHLWQALEDLAGKVVEAVEGGQPEVA